MRRQERLRRRNQTQFKLCQCYNLHKETWHKKQPIWRWKCEVAGRRTDSTTMLINCCCFMCASGFSLLEASAETITMRSVPSVLAYQNSSLLWSFCHELEPQNFTKIYDYKSCRLAGSVASGHKKIIKRLLFVAINSTESKQREASGMKFRLFGLIKSQCRW